METSGGEGKRNLREKAKKVVEEEEDGDEEEEYGLGLGFGDDDKKKRAVASGRKASAGGGVSSPCCQAERCTADLNEAKRYHRRHKVCEHHSKAPVVLVSGFQQRFCQQCSRFHELAEFDETKRSCRRRLAGHNERRRKSSSESQEGSTQKGVDQLRENHCRQADERGKIQITVPGNSTYKHFQIR